MDERNPVELGDREGGELELDGGRRDRNQKRDRAARLLRVARILRGHGEIGVRPEEIARQIGLEGMVLVYTPRTFEELEVLWSLVVDAYCYVTERPRPSLDRVS